MRERIKDQYKVKSAAGWLWSTRFIALGCRRRGARGGPRLYQKRLQKIPNRGGSLMLPRHWNELFRVPFGFPEPHITICTVPVPVHQCCHHVCPFKWISRSPISIEGCLAMARADNFKFDPFICRLLRQVYRECIHRRLGRRVWYDDSPWQSSRQQSCN